MWLVSYSILVWTMPTLMCSWLHGTLQCLPLVLWYLKELEKKNYDHQTTQPKSKRRLLLDRINSGILEMYRQFTNPPPWVRSATAVLCPRWSKNQLQEKNAKKEFCTDEPWRCSSSGLPLLCRAVGCPSRATPT